MQVVNARTLARCAIGALIVGASSIGAHAALVSTEQLLNFDAGKQSLWGLGGVAASFNASGSVGSSTLGFNYSAQASTGTVEQASFDGLLHYTYNDTSMLGTRDLLTFNFTGNSNGGLFETLFGASLETNYQILGGEGCIYCRGASLNVEKTFTPELDIPFSGSDTATPATAEVGPNIGVASGTAGVDIDVRQTSTLEGTGISGAITAVNRATGDVRNVGLSVADNGFFNVDLGLDLAGLWDVTLSSLTLDNSFFSSFAMNLVPFVQYTIGVGCGDAGRDSDNGLLCGGDGRADWNLANISLGSTQSFALTFNQLDLAPFTIDVRDQVASVPEPDTLTLLGIGLLSLAALRRRTATTSETAA